MRDLDVVLEALGRELDVPPAPDLGGAVAARLRTERAAGARRRMVVPALAAVAVAAATAAALAVPQARSALLELLGLRGAGVERVQTLPRAAVGAPLVPGTPVSVAEARRGTDFPLHLPPGRCALFLDRSLPGGMVSAVCPPEGTRRLVLTQFRGEQTPYVGKFVAPGTDVRAVDVEGSRGVWIEGAPHALLFRDAQGRVRERTRRLAGDVLLWERDGVTYRLEGALGGAEGALRLARDLR